MINLQYRSEAPGHMDASIICLLSIIEIKVNGFSTVDRFNRSIGWKQTKVDFLP